jgi:AcrR family transcriptional regulator
LDLLWLLPREWLALLEPCATWPQLRVGSTASREFFRPQSSHGYLAWCVPFNGELQLAAGRWRAFRLERHAAHRLIGFLPPPAPPYNLKERESPTKRGVGVGLYCIMAGVGYTYIPTGRYNRGVMRQHNRAELTRQRLLDAALRCFAEQGYDAAGVAIICDLAEVSKGAFYHHFDSKQAIFLALMQDWLESLDQQLTMFQADMVNVPAGLRSMKGLLSQVLEVGGHQLPMYLEFWSRATRDPEVWRETIEPFQRYRAFFEAMLLGGMQEGSIRMVRADHAARVLVAFAVGLLMQGLLEPAGEDWTEVTELGLDILMNGLMEVDHP